MKHRLTTSLLALSLITVSSMSQAAETPVPEKLQINVTANVAAYCKFVGTETDVTFGSLQASPLASNATAQGTVSVWCSSGQPYSLAFANNNVYQMTGKVDSTSKLPYTLTINSGVSRAAYEGEGTGSIQAIPLTAEISSADLQSAKPQDYTGMVTLELNLI